MQVPSVNDLLQEAIIQQALAQAWLDSEPHIPNNRREQGGWIYFDPTTQTVLVRRAATGGQADLDLSAPEIITGAFIVATFHTHPNPTAEGWNPQPSAADTRSAWLLGVPCIVKADDGIYTTGPTARRGGLTGNPGYPD